eukprot:Lithocolla_globosa_v1_NODE_1067_length_2899_cov_17.481364.p4 type:complete len:125 gc:universal NODE_1067_length_2899_cov_17.481364:1757-2131(+)
MLPGQFQHSFFNPLVEVCRVVAKGRREAGHRVHVNVQPVIECLPFRVLGGGSHEPVPLMRNEELFSSTRKLIRLQDVFITAIFESLSRENRTPSDEAKASDKTIHFRPCALIRGVQRRLTKWVG